MFFLQLLQAVIILPFALLFLFIAGGVFGIISSMLLEMLFGIPQNIGFWLSIVFLIISMCIFFYYSVFTDDDLDAAPSQTQGFLSGFIPGFLLGRWSK